MRVLDVQRRCIVAAVVSLACYLALGAAVAHAEPAFVERAAVALRGHGVAAAELFTRVGRFDVYAVVCACLLGFALVRRAWLGRVALAVVTLVAAWQTSDLLKQVFGRPRPEHMIGVRETSYSYASGHATLALAFYGLLAYYVATGARARSGLPAGPVLLGGLIAAIGWSRLALGAHYLTDVLGGYLLGAAFLCTAILVDVSLRSHGPARTGALAQKS